MINNLNEILMINTKKYESITEGLDIDRLIEDEQNNTDIRGG